MLRSGFVRRALALALLSACAHEGGELHDELSSIPLASAASSLTRATRVAADPPRLDPVSARRPPTPRERAPEHIRGIYVNPSAAGAERHLASLLALADTTEINAFVVDVKTESGIHYPSSIPLAGELTRPGSVTIRDTEAFVDALHERGLWAIARIVVFKDLVLTRARPGWSIRRPDGGLWIDKAGNSWVSAWHPEVREYNLAIAEEVARAGFDEIQFDYVRFPEPYPSLPEQVHPQEGGDRTEAIASFLRDAKRRLHPLGVTVTADVFGMAMNDVGDVGIGQQWERLSAAADHLLPMVYPSHYFSTHLPGVARPNRMPYETVATAIGMGVIRNDRLREAGGTPARIVPWLQAFDAPWVDRDFPYGAAEARAQIQAVYDVGLEDWILWHPGSRYDAVAPALSPDERPRARVYEAPDGLLSRIDLWEGWGMARERSRAVGSL